MLKKLLLSLNKDETVIHVHGWTKTLSSSIFGVIFKLEYKMVLTCHDYFSACLNGGYFNYKANKICELKPLSFECIKCNCDSRNYLFKIYRILRAFVQNNIVGLNRKIKNVIGISDLSIDVLKRTLNEKVNIEKILNPISFSNKGAKKDYRNNSGFLYVGRVAKEKGVETFCSAITSLNCKGIVVGDGSELNRLKEKYTNIEFVGWKNKEEVIKYIDSSRGLVLPSLWYEGAPLTPLEAMNDGIPCLISEKCSAREYVNDIENRRKLVIF